MESSFGSKGAATGRLSMRYKVRRELVEVVGIWG
jgi:hypothetical protein